MKAKKRNLKRIPSVLKKIRKYWEKYPDLRLTQLIVNIVNPEQPCPEVFYMEDNTLVERLNKELGKYHG